MKKIIARMNFIFEDKKYITGDEIDTRDIVKIKKLNELGYIEPLNYEDLVLIEREINKEI